jgi:hypothetical protein
LAPALVTAGGGPAGVVEFVKLNRPPGFDVAGVVDPAGAEEEGVAAPNGEGACDVVSVLSGVGKPLAAGVEFSLFSSAFLPKVNPAPPKGLDAPVVLPAPPNNPALLELPVLAPNSEAVEVPEAGVDTVLKPNVNGF